MTSADADRDCLRAVAWQCGSSDPNAASAPDDLARAVSSWCPGPVPGTVAGALRDAGRWHWGGDDEELLDGRDWWYRCRFAATGEGPWELRLDGLATVADVWLNGEPILHSESMFVAHRLSVTALAPDNELTLRFSALDPLLARRRPRPRWRSRLLRAQSMRFLRTTVLGRVPGWSRWAAPVGPWRPVTLMPVPVVSLADHHLEARCVGEGAKVCVRATLRGRWSPQTTPVVCLRVGEGRTSLAVAVQGDEAVAEGTLDLARVERWWPHTHGSQPLYTTALEVDGTRFDLGRVGFRTVEVDRSDGAFALIVNDEPVFCRGACWVGPDVVSFNPPPADLRRSLERLRDAGMNMVRIGGYSVYEGPAFFDACDELGVLVWQDCMLASFDPPEEEAFVAEVQTELRQVLGGLAGRPAPVVVCGSSETYQQAAMYGLSPDRWNSPLLEQTIPALVDEILPGMPYVASSPSGGDLPFHSDSGVAHYFGVGAYMRPATDVRVAGVRFAAECLSFAIPPEPETVQELFGGAAAAGHAPDWKQGVTRDSGVSWDFEDIRDHYVRELFAVDPLAVRYADPEQALDLGRAAVAELMAQAMTFWRRRSSRCAGALILSWQDLWPGAGWGLLDSLGRPKAPWYTLRRTLAPVAVLISDEGLSGLRVHVFNDRATALDARLTLEVYAPNGTCAEQVEHPVQVPARGEVEISAESLLGGFRDLNWAYRFAPPGSDVVVARLTDTDDRKLGEAVHLALGLARPREPDVGLTARADRSDAGDWTVTLSTRLLAQSVAIDVPGFCPEDSWFHLAPGSSRTVALVGATADAVPTGRVRALNSSTSVRVATA